MKSHHYMAAPIPRYIRQTKLGHLPMDCIIGTTTTKAQNGANISFDIVMLPDREFNRMKTYAGAGHNHAPSLNAGSALEFGFMISNTKRFTVPAEEKDPKAFAASHFLKEFGITHN